MTEQKPPPTPPSTEVSSATDQPQAAGKRPRLPHIREHMTRDNARFVWLSILPVGIALISFVLSVYNIVSDRQPPDVVMTMPIRVRVAQGGTTPWLYIQPRFVNTGDNNRNEIIQNLTIEVAAAGDSSPQLFAWDEQGTWLYSTRTFQVDWQFVADPAPIVVGPNDPQFPLGLFIGSSDWPWQAGTYRVTVIAERTVQHEPLRATVEFTLTPELMQVVADPDGPFLVELPTRAIT